MAGYVWLTVPLLLVISPTNLEYRPAGVADDHHILRRELLHILLQKVEFFEYFRQKMVKLKHSKFSIPLNRSKLSGQPIHQSETRDLPRV